LPSLLASADEKFGVEAWLLEVPPADDEDGSEELELLSELDGLLLEDDGVDEDEDELDDGLVADGLDDEEEDCATARVERANRTAAVVMLRVFGMDESPEFWGTMLQVAPVQTLCR